MATPIEEELSVNEEIKKIISELPDKERDICNKFAESLRETIKQLGGPILLAIALVGSEQD